MNKKALDTIMSAIKTIEGSEKLMLSPIVRKAEKLLEKNPGDQTTVGILRILRKKEAANQLFVSKAELKNIHKAFATQDSEFENVFEKELDIKHEEEKEAAKPEPVKEPIKIKVNTELKDIFEKLLTKQELTPYSKDDAKNAEEAVVEELDSIDIKPASAKVEKGNKEFVVVNVCYETPKGSVYLFIPVEIMKDKAKLVGSFIGNDGVVDISNENIKKYIKDQVGKKCNLTSKIVFEKLLEKPIDKITSVELVVAKKSLDGCEKDLVGELVQRLEYLLEMEAHKFQYTTL